MSFEFVFHVLRGTPLWVFAVLAVLLAVSIPQLWPNVRSLRRILVIPVLFTAWGLIGLLDPAATLPMVLRSWLPAAVLGAVIASRVALPMRVDREQARVWQPGSPVSLIRNLVLFLGHYIFHVAAIIHPQAQAVLKAGDLAVSGLAAGYFIAWGIRFAQGYGRAPGMDPGGRTALAAVAVR